MAIDDAGDTIVVTDGAVAVTGGKIVWLGPTDAIPPTLARQAGRIHDLEGRWVTPGLIDCHTHIVYGGSRAREFEMRLNGASYAEIAATGGGILSTVEATRAASADTLLHDAVSRVRNLCAEGVTTIEIKSGYGLDIATELKMLEVARRISDHLPIEVVTTFLGAHAVPPEYAGQPDAYVRYVCDTVLPEVADTGLADAVDTFCETIAFSPRQVASVFERAAELGLSVKLHAEQLSDSGGGALAARYRALSADHLDHLSAASAKAMADAGTVGVVLPGAYYFLQGTQPPPIDLMRTLGMRIAIATDSNPGTSPTTSLLLMMNMACVLFSMTPSEALVGLTRNAAKALGLSETHGSLEVGKTADFVAWDVDGAVDLAYRFGANPCAFVVKAGRIVHRAAST